MGLSSGAGRLWEAVRRGRRRGVVQLGRRRGWARARAAEEGGMGWRTTGPTPTSSQLSTTYTQLA